MTTGETPAAAVTALYAAVVAGDVDAILDRYEHTADVTVFLEGPRWLTVGHDAVATGWRAFAAASVRLRSVVVEDGPHVHTGGDLAVVAQVVRIAADAGGQARSLRMRMTHVLRRGGDGRWRTVHEHASQPLADPYGTGDWLDPGGQP